MQSLLQSLTIMSDYIAFSSRAPAPYNTLSNFYLTPLYIPFPFKDELLHVKSVEHYYVYMKVEHFYQYFPSLKHDLLRKVLAATSGSAAKKIGQTIHPALLQDNHLHSTWNEIKPSIMRIAVYHKGEQSAPFSRTLIHSGDTKLHEVMGRPNFWNFPGQDTMGIICTEVRASNNNRTLSNDKSALIAEFRSTFTRRYKQRQTLRRKAHKRLPLWKFLAGFEYLTT